MGQIVNPSWKHKHSNRSASGEYSHPRGTASASFVGKAPLQSLHRALFPQESHILPPLVL